MGKGMKAGKKPKVSQAAQMQQLQAMQAKLQEAQAEIERMETEAGAGGGAVTVKVNGKHEMVSINIKPEVLDDAEMLSDLIVAATNEAMRQMDELSQARMNSATGGFGF